MGRALRRRGAGSIRARRPGLGRSGRPGPSCRWSCRSRATSSQAGGPQMIRPDPSWCACRPPDGRRSAIVGRCDPVRSVPGPPADNPCFVARCGPSGRGRRALPAPAVDALVEGATRPVCRRRRRVGEFGLAQQDGTEPAHPRSVRRAPPAVRPRPGSCPGTRRRRRGRPPRATGSSRRMRRRRASRERPTRPRRRRRGPCRARHSARRRRRDRRRRGPPPAPGPSPRSGGIPIRHAASVVASQ